MRYKYWLSVHRWLALGVALQLLLWLGSGLLLSVTGHAERAPVVAPILPVTQLVPPVTDAPRGLEQLSIKRELSQTAPAGWVWERRVAGETTRWHAGQQQWQSLPAAKLNMSLWQDWAYRLHFMDYDGADAAGSYDFNHSLVRGFGLALLLLSISGVVALVRIIRQRRLWPVTRRRT